MRIATLRGTLRCAAIGWLALAWAATVGLADGPDSTQAGAASVGESPAKANPVGTIVTSNSGTWAFNGINLNRFVGAETFYWAGYGGWNAVLANVEAGHIWSGHETLGHVTTFVTDPSVAWPSRPYDWHATMVGHVLGGRGWGYGWILNDFDLATWFGIAADATLWSGSIATEWVPHSIYDYTGRFETTVQSLAHTYRTVMETGVSGRKADVVNSSWGFDDPAGRVLETRIIDALAYANGTTVVIAAGNHDGTGEPVGGPASGYNSIAVAALESDTSVPPYKAAASFSCAGPNDYYNAKTGQTVLAVRAAVDIAAPGDNLTVAFYGGVTGGHTSGSDPVAGSGQYYIVDMGGTSFASPIVAGGAALVVDVGYDRFGGGSSIDGRVVKAVLMNSADKLSGWDNATSLEDGVITTRQSLDWATGAGRLNLTRAFSQYTAGTTDAAGLGGATVRVIGWDFGQVVAGSPTDYRIDQPLLAGSDFAATLTWFVNRVFDADALTAEDVQFADLDLEVWQVVDGQPASLVAQSISAFNNVEHLYFTVPQTGYYLVRVLWFGENYDVPGNTLDSEYYGLAWSAVAVPEPATMILLAVGGASLVLVKIRRRRLRAAG